MIRIANSSFTPTMTRRALLGASAAAGALALLGPASSAFAGLSPSEDTWNTIKSDYFANIDFQDGSHILALDAPLRAHDAAIVPLDIKVSDKQAIKTLTLIIDENPVPLAAKFTYGAASAQASIQTRVRVNAYSYVRVVAEAVDGTHFMVKRFVKASGGCAAPSGKDPEAAIANMGKMRLRRFGEANPRQSANPREAQLMLRHPNHSGFQMDQVTLLFVPAEFVETITIQQGDEMILTVEGGISLSEDPNLRFFYRENPAEPITVTAIDTEGRVFKHSWTAAES